MSGHAEWRAARGLTVSWVLAGLIFASPAAAQTTLVVRGDGRSHAALASAADGAMRDATGARVHRVEVTLDELALAAGCTGLPAEPACVSAILVAAGAAFLAVEYLRTTDEGEVLRVELWSPSGERMRTVDARCAGAACGPALERAWDGAPASRGRRSLDASLVLSTPTDPPPRGLSLRTSTLFFGGAALAGVGAIVAGAFAVDASARVGRLTSDRRPDAGQLTVALTQRDVATAVSVGFACVGAGLAVTALVLLLSDSNVEVAMIPLADGGALSFTGTF